MIAKPLCMRFDEIDGFIRVYDGTISVKSGITYIISHNYAKIKVDSYDFLPLGKAMTFHDVLILIESVLNKDKNNYYYNIFLEKAFYQVSKK